MPGSEAGTEAIAAQASSRRSGGALHPGSEAGVGTPNALNAKPPPLAQTKLEGQPDESTTATNSDMRRAQSATCNANVRKKLPPSADRQEATTKHKRLQEAHLGTPLKTAFCDVPPYPATSASGPSNADNTSIRARSASPRRIAPQMPDAR